MKRYLDSNWNLSFTTLEGKHYEIPSQLPGNMIGDLFRANIIPDPEFYTSNGPGGIMAVGSLGAKYIFRALADHGYADDAVKILMQTDFPSYGYWVRHFDATTLFENWRGNSSLNHIMFGDISAWMYQYLAGITPVESAPGFKHIEFRPCFVKDLDFVEAEHISPFGKICASWKREGKKIHFRCEVPDGCTAELFAGERKKTLSAGLHEDVFEIQGQSKNESRG